MKPNALSLPVAAALVCAIACGQTSQPTFTQPSGVQASSTPAPSSGPSPQLGFPPGYDQVWNLSILDTGQEGIGCVYRGGSRSEVDGLGLGLQGTALKLLYWVSNPTDDLELTATVASDGSFSGGAPSQAFSDTLCPSTGTFQPSIVGQFSADKTHLEADETDTYQFSGVIQKLHFHWSADLHRSR